MYTNLEQSKKLAEILPFESADMCYRIVAYNSNDTYEYRPYCFSGTLESDIPCWSLAALLDNIPQVKLDSVMQYDKKQWRCCAFFASEWYNSDWYINPVDACYEMIIKNLGGLS